MSVGYAWLHHEVEAMTSKDLERWNELLQRMSRNSPRLTMDDAHRLAGVINHHILFARDLDAGKRLVGTARLTTIPMLVGFEGVIEDVVVDQAYEGRGIGREIGRRLMTSAQEMRLVRVSLVTTADNAAADRLYRSLGFEPMNGYLPYRAKIAR